MHPLAERLYRLLCLMFAPVRIVESEGVPVRHARSDSRPRAPRRLNVGGTGFRVDCPFCGDWEQRLYIDARYGTYDPRTKSDNLDLVVCLAADCLADLGNRQFLAGCIYGDGPCQLLANYPILVPTSQLPATPDVLPEVSPPGRVIPLNELHPNHPVVLYLAGRGYDVQELTTVWGLGFCVASHFRMMRRRVYIPIFRDGVLVGWQGRWPAEVDRRIQDVPKYYTMPGLRKNHLLYNYDVARQQPLVVICEGCSDIWRVGPAGVALLGKTASREQLSLLVSGWAGKPGIVLLDADAGFEARELFDRLRPVFGERLVRAILPEGLDPGACPRPELWRFLRSTATRRGVVLPEEVPPEQR